MRKPDWSSKLSKRSKHLIRIPFRMNRTKQTEGQGAIAAPRLVPCRKNRHTPEQRKLFRFDAVPSQQPSVDEVTGVNRPASQRFRYGLDNLALAKPEKFGLHRCACLSSNPNLVKHALTRGAPDDGAQNLRQGKVQSGRVKTIWNI